MQFFFNFALIVMTTFAIFPGLGWLMILISGIVSWYFWNTPQCLPSDPEARAAIDGVTSSSIGNTSDVLVNTTIYSVGGNYTTEVEIVRNISSAKEFWQ